MTGKRDNCDPGSCFSCRLPLRRTLVRFVQ